LPEQLLYDRGRHLLPECADDALTLFHRTKDAHHPPLDLVGDETGSESRQHEHHTLRKVKRQPREQRACGHLAAWDDYCRQDHILCRRNASGKHRKHEVESQRREDDEHSIEIGGGALQQVYRVYLARAEQNEDARTLVSTNALQNRSHRGKVLPCSSRRPTI
jgi:hypothetical protein